MMLVWMTTMSSTAQPGWSTLYGLVGGDRNGLALNCLFCACHCFGSTCLQPAVADTVVLDKHNPRLDWAIAFLDAMAIAIQQHSCVGFHLHLSTDHYEIV